jgi:hypothetical protein
MWKIEGHGLESTYKSENLTNVKQGFIFVDFNFLILKMKKIPKIEKLLSLH